jgi:hypothetical protein
MAERDLKELEDVLWEEFDAARKKHRTFSENEFQNYSSQSYPSHFPTENRKAMAELGNAIANIRRERRMEKWDADQRKAMEEIENGTRRDISISKPLKIKP